MKLRTPNPFPRFALLSLIMAPCLLYGQASRVFPISAWIKIVSNEDAFKVDIYDAAREGTSTMSLAGQNQKRVVDLSGIEKIRFLYPPEVTEALDAVEQREVARAERILRDYSYALIPFLGVPEHNVDHLLKEYLQSLHQINETELLREVYTRLSLSEAPSFSRKAEIWLAYLDTRAGELDAANVYFSDPSIGPDSGELFYLQQLAFCRIHMKDNAYRTAIDHSARVIALGTIEDPLYPEALLLSAQCYDGLAEAEQARLRQLREEVLRKELLAERVNVALELEAAADREGTPPPSEQDILDAIDPQAVEDRVPSVPPISENAFALIAQRLYLFNEQVFPSTDWGRQAGAKVWQETRERREKDLSTFTLSETPKQPGK